MCIVPKSGSTSKVRDELKDKVRANELPCYLYGNKANGYAITVRVGDTYKVVSDTMSRDEAIAWCERKLKCKPRQQPPMPHLKAA